MMPPTPRPSDFSYPKDLPIVAHHDEILQALRQHRVIVVCGDTGSGKTTQLPKIALEAGFGARGRRIACTQPRRLAAVTMAERVAHELRTPVGGLVGFQHRYGRNLSADTRIKFMTDGVLLAETRGDPLLRRYDCIIIDEAHERSLNVDFLLGILKRILTRRRDLKVIIASATLDTALFSAFFDNAPALTIPGRLYPIEIRHLREEAVEDTVDLPRDVSDAVRELPRTGDILVFLPGERDIRECADALTRQNEGDDIIPLLAALPAAEQKRAFLPSPRRRIILATNIAETSVTIPNIRYVIDSGLARISRYVHRTHVQRLQIEPISQASARQRAGRCGRVGPGVCLRLYTEADFAARDAYTPPEILRSSLAGVILTMLDLGLGDVAKFPFLEPPRPAMITEGLRELLELGAITRNARDEPCLTAIGRKLVRIPVEPRLARILLAASEWAALPQAIPVVAAMSCDDPRRRPVDEREKAQQAHAPFRKATKADGAMASDFLVTLALWRWWKEHAAELSQSKLRKLCQTTYLSYPKMREWAELVRQLERLCAALKLDTTHDNGGNVALHRALLTGLLTRIGHFDAEAHDYRGARGIRFAAHPSSILGKKPPEWIMAGELVDTSRLYGRELAPLDVGWIEAAAGPLAKHHCHSPAWDAASGFVRATEQVTLYGLVIVPERRCDYARFNPAEARALFIRRGILDCAIQRPPPALRQNMTFLTQLRQHAEKLRRPEIFDEEALAAFFDAVLPHDVSNAPALAKWLRRATAREIAAFRLTKEQWWPTDKTDDIAYPDTIRIGDVIMRLTYHHAPDKPELDGITCTVRRAQARALRLWRADWLVPGLLPAKLSWMLSVLPTAQRKVLTPISETVTRLIPLLKPGSAPLADAVVQTIYDEWGFRITPEAWQRARLPDHLRVRFVIRDDETGKPIVASRDVEEALAHVGIIDHATSVPSSSRGADADRPHTTWDFGTLPEKAAHSRAGWQLEYFPALHDEETGVSLRLYAHADEAARAHADAVTRLYLILLAPKATVSVDRRSFDICTTLYLKDIGYATDALARDILAGAIRATLVNDRPALRSAEAFAQRLDEQRTALMACQAEMLKIVRQALSVGAELLNRAEGDAQLADASAEAIQTQLVWLLAPGFPRTTPLANLRHYERYLKGVAIRLQRARTAHGSDIAKEERFAPYWQRYRTALANTSSARPAPETLLRYRWMLEEFRISLFAQELHTPEPVSEKRLDKLLPPFPVP